MSRKPAVPNANLITSEMIQCWKDERSRVIAELTEIQSKISLLKKSLTQVDALLRAASVFSPELQEWWDEEDEKAMGAEGVALTAAIKKAIFAHKGNPVARDGIRNMLPQYGYSLQKLQVNPNYLYTALKRLVARKEIVEDPAGQYRLQQI
jgi:hypothetical protein